MSKHGFVQVEGLENIAIRFDNLSKTAGKKLQLAVSAALEPIEIGIKNNIGSMFGNGNTPYETTNILMNSVGKSVKWVPTEQTLFASVGVYDMSRKTGIYLNGKRRLEATYIAFWYEFGIRPHSLTKGDRLSHESRGRGKQTPGSKIHPGSQPIPFISSSFESRAPSLFQQIERELDNIVMGTL